MKMIKNLKKIGIVIASIGMLMTSCSSDNEPEAEIINSENVTLADMKGKWIVINATSEYLKGIYLDLSGQSSCYWFDEYRDYVGPYYYWGNLNDETLKEQCALVCSTVNDQLHISEVKVSGRISGNADLKMKCGLMAFLPERDWQYFNERVDSSAWYFWRGNWATYIFEITEYSDTKMVLNLTEYSVRFCDYEDDYPLRMEKGEVLVLERQ